ncbi:ABC-type transport auxiliary lipoprotein family protein [Rugamonas sp.]|uniref:ABC-type transport auxiliary lipoprotein family protein n=1 Tax=Rugamonas sp. TaxID=1926287 RepID=UPI0025EB7FDD|nr:ABC-type transport auxiliary lipoprotein family protein [Rugamonas sp.]
MHPLPTRRAGIAATDRAASIIGIARAGRAIAGLIVAAGLAACSTPGPTPTEFDFGPLPQRAAPAGAAVSATANASANTSAAAPTPMAAVVIVDVSGPATLDTQRMYYRLLYADAQQSHPYAYNNWNSTPLQLLTLRLKARVAQAGVKVLSPTDASVGMALLRVEVDDFGQYFDSASHSSGQINLRASVFRGHRLLDQRSFRRSSPAGSADAAGGARALADATDALADDILAWMAALPPQ